MSSVLYIKLRADRAQSVLPVAFPPFRLFARPLTAAERGPHRALQLGPSLRRTRAHHPAARPPAAAPGACAPAHARRWQLLLTETVGTEHLERSAGRRSARQRKLGANELGCPGVEVVDGTACAASISFAEELARLQLQESRPERSELTFSIDICRPDRASSFVESTARDRDAISFGSPISPRISICPPGTTRTSLTPRMGSRPLCAHSSPGRLRRRDLYCS